MKFHWLSVSIELCNGNDCYVALDDWKVLMNYI
jgi:hypothetical protein